MQRLFVVIERLNSILLLLIFLIAGASLAWLSWSSNQRERRGAIELPIGDDSSKAQVLLRFDRVESINGADTQMMRLTADSESAKFSSGGGYGGETRNVLFLTGKEKTARWLFPNQKNLILAAAQLKEESTDEKDSLTKALYFEYVRDDTDGDGKLSVQDNSNIGLTRSDGTAFVEVLRGVTRVLSYDMLDSRDLSVVYQLGKTVRHARFSLNSLAKETDQEVVTVPEE